MKKLEFYRHNINSDVKKKILECLDGMFLTCGDYVSEFENNFAQYLDVKYAVGLNSCTAALHLALLSLGIGKGDEVITSPMTFIATATAILHAGAKPVFVDVERETALIDPDKIEKAVTRKTRAIIPVHLYGQMCDMKKIKKIADKYDLRIVEDAAHCIEGERAGVKPGQLGDVACFSFYATKNITSGEGGAIGTNRKQLADKIKLLRQHGISKEASDRHSGRYKHWDMVEYGWKYNMDNIQGAMLLPQLQKIDSAWERRKKLYKVYIRQLDKVPGVRYPKIEAESKSAYHLFTIWVNGNRDCLLKKFSDREVGVAVNYRAIHLLTYFRKYFGFKKGDFPIAEDIGERTVSLPFWIGMKHNDVKKVVDIIREWKHGNTIHI